MNALENVVCRMAVNLFWPSMCLTKQIMVTSVQEWTCVSQRVLHHPFQRARLILSWWRHQMETFSALLALCVGNSPVPVNSPHKGQWRGALMFSLIYASINDWVNNREAGDLRRQRGHYDVIVMCMLKLPTGFLNHKGVATNIVYSNRQYCLC